MTILKKVSVVVPIYNEEKNINNLYQEIYDSLSSKYIFEICFINDGSKDLSLECLKTLDSQYVKIINNNINCGQSFSIFTGVKNCKYDCVVTIDGDGQNPPSEIPKLLNIYFQNDDKTLIGGIRKDRKDSFFKVYGSKIANKFRSLILNDGCEDTGCGLKVFSKNNFLKLPYFNGFHRFFPALFQSINVKCIFIEVHHRKRNYGSSKYNNFRRFFKGLIDIVRVKYIISKKNV
jgi:dolichol-phosphate mannosyltransferase